MNNGKGKGYSSRTTPNVQRFVQGLFGGGGGGGLNNVPGTSFRPWTRRWKRRVPLKVPSSLGKSLLWRHGYGLRIHENTLYTLTYQWSIREQKDIYLRELYPRSDEVHTCLDMDMFSTQLTFVTPICSLRNLSSGLMRRSKAFWT